MSYQSKNNFNIYFCNVISIRTAALHICTQSERLIVTSHFHQKRWNLGNSFPRKFELEVVTVILADLIIAIDYFVMISRGEIILCEHSEKQIVALETFSGYVTVSVVIYMTNEN